MFSRFNYVRPLKSKRAEEVAGKIEEIILEMKFLPRFFTSDKGGEFDGWKIQWLRDSIEH